MCAFGTKNHECHVKSEHVPKCNDDDDEDYLLREPQPTSVSEVQKIKSKDFSGILKKKLAQLLLLNCTSKN